MAMPQHGRVVGARCPVVVLDLNNHRDKTSKNSTNLINQPIF